MADFSDAELASGLRVHRRTIQRWCSAGKLPGAYKAGRSWRVPPSALTRAKLEPGLQRDGLERELKGTALLFQALSHEIDEMRLSDRAAVERNWRKVALELGRLQVALDDLTKRAAAVPERLSVGTQAGPGPSARRSLH